MDLKAYFDAVIAKAQEYWQYKWFQYALLALAVYGIIKFLF